MEGELELDAVEEAFLRGLVDRGVRFVIVGGHTKRFHGLDRPARDLDIVVEPSEENAGRLILALGDMHEGGPCVTVEKLSQTKKKLPIARYGVDVLTSVDPVPFPNLLRDSTTVQHRGMAIPVCSREHLLQILLVSGRPEDRRDYDCLLGSAGR